MKKIYLIDANSFIYRMFYGVPEFITKKGEYVNAVFGIAIGAYIVKEAYELIKEGAEVLLDISLPEKEVQKVKDIIESDSKITDFHFLKTRHAGKYKFLEVHIVLEPDISLFDAHNIADGLEEKIKKLDNSVMWHILIHMDPYDDSAMHDV